jgi:hypothetical protein
VNWPVFMESSVTSSSYLKELSQPRSFDRATQVSEQISDERSIDATNSAGYLISFFDESTTTRKVIRPSPWRNCILFGVSNGQTGQYLSNNLPEALIAGDFFNIMAQEAITNEESISHITSPWIMRGFRARKDYQFQAPLNAAAIDLLTEWLSETNNEDAAEQKQSLEATKASLDSHRSPHRKLYP